MTLSTPPVSTISESAAGSDTPSTTLTNLKTVTPLTVFFYTGAIMSQEIKLTITVNSVIDNLDDSGLPEGDPEINIFTTNGTLLVNDRGKKLTFTEVSEDSVTKSALYISDKKILLQKRGAIESDMTFIENEDSKTVYRVGPYAFDMVVRTKKIRNSLTDNGGELSLLYTMNVGGQEKNVRMKITAKRK